MVYVPFLPEQPGPAVEKKSPPVAIIMGSQSDWPTMRHAAEMLDGLGVAYDARIVSAHRTPDRLVSFAKGAKAAATRSGADAGSDQSRDS